MTAIGNYTDFVGSTANGLPSVSFPSEFPFAWRFNETSQANCKDLSTDILAWDTVMSALFGLVLATSAGIFYWVRYVLISVLGRWEISISDFSSHTAFVLASGISHWQATQPPFLVCHHDYRNFCLYRLMSP